MRWSRFLYFVSVLVGTPKPVFNCRKWVKRNSWVRDKGLGVFTERIPHVQLTPKSPATSSSIDVSSTMKRKRSYSFTSKSF